MRDVVRVAADVLCSCRQLDFFSNLFPLNSQVPQDWYDKFANVTNDENACGDDIPQVRRKL